MQNVPLQTFPSIATVNVASNSLEDSLESQILLGFKNLQINENEEKKVIALANRIQKRVNSHTLNPGSIAKYQLEFINMNFTPIEATNLIHVLILSTQIGDQEKKKKIFIPERFQHTESHCIKKIISLLSKQNSNRIYPEICGYFYYPKKNTFSHILTEENKTIVSRVMIESNQEKNHRTHLNSYLIEDFIRRFRYEIFIKSEEILLIVTEILEAILQTKEFPASAQYDLILSIPVAYRSSIGNNYLFITFIKILKRIDWNLNSKLQILNQITNGSFGKEPLVLKELTFLITNIPWVQNGKITKDLTKNFQTFIISIFNGKLGSDKKTFSLMIKTVQSILGSTLNDYLNENLDFQYEIASFLPKSPLLSKEELIYLIIPYFYLKDEHIQKYFFDHAHNNDTSVIKTILESIHFDLGKKIILIQNIVSRIKDTHLFISCESIFSLFFDQIVYLEIKNLPKDHDIILFINRIVRQKYFSIYSKKVIHMELNRNILHYIEENYLREEEKVKKHLMIYYQIIFQMKQKNLMTDQDIRRSLENNLKRDLSEKKVLSCIQSIDISIDDLFNLDFILLPSDDRKRIIVVSADYYGKIILDLEPDNGFNNFFSFILNENNYEYEIQKIAHHNTEEIFKSFPLFLSVYNKYQNLALYDKFFCQLKLGKYETDFLAAIKSKSYKKNLTKSSNQTEVGSIFSQFITDEKWILYSGNEAFHHIEVTDKFTQFIWSTFSVNDKDIEIKLGFLFLISLIFAKLSGVFYFGCEYDSLIPIRNIAFGLLKKIESLDSKNCDSKKFIDTHTLKKLQYRFCGIDENGDLATRSTFIDSDNRIFLGQTANFCVDILASTMKSHLEKNHGEIYHSLPLEWK